VKILVSHLADMDMKAQPGHGPRVPWQVQMPTGRCCRLPRPSDGSLVPEGDSCRKAPPVEPPSKALLREVGMVAVRARLFAWAAEEE